MRYVFMLTKNKSSYQRYKNYFYQYCSFVYSVCACEFSIYNSLFSLYACIFVPGVCLCMDYYESCLRACDTGHQSYIPFSNNSYSFQVLQSQFEVNLGGIKTCSDWCVQACSLLFVEQELKQFRIIVMKNPSFQRWVREFLK